MTVRVIAATQLAALEEYLRCRDGVELVSVPGTVQEALIAVKETNPELLLLSRYLPGILSNVQTLISLREAASSARIVLFAGSDRNEVELLQDRCKLAKVECVTGDLTYLTLDNILLQGTTQPSSPEPVNEEAAPQFTDLSQPPTSQVAQRVVAFYSPKGGTGTTLLAANFASLAAKSGIRTAVVDLNFVNPNLHIHLASPTPTGMTAPDSSRTIQALLPGLASKSLTPRSLGDFLTPTVGDLKLLPGPIYQPKDVQRIEYHHIEYLIELLTAPGLFDLIVLDCAPYVASDGTFAALMLATNICLVTTSCASAVHDQVRQLQLLDSLGIPRLNYIHVLNQYDPRLTPLREIERVTGLPIVTVIPSEHRDATRSINQGTPLAVSVPKHAIPTALLPLLYKLSLITPSRKRFSLERRQAHG